MIKIQDFNIILQYILLMYKTTSLFTSRRKGPEPPEWWKNRSYRQIWYHFHYLVYRVWFIFL